jgi:hypothetical protein
MSVYKHILVAVDFSDINRLAKQHKRSFEPFQSREQTATR